MKQCSIFIVMMVAAILVLSGCDLVTKDQPKEATRYGSDMVVNEVFAISPDRFYSYSWIELYNPTARTIQWQDISHPITGYLFGANGTIRKTEDNGKTWRALGNASGTINGLSMVLPDTGFAIGDAGLFMRTNDSGNTWTPEPILGGSTANFNAFLMPSVYDIPGARTGWIVGDNGIIANTRDRAHTWSLQASGTRKNLRAISFVNNPPNTSVLDVWVVGDSGAVIHTTNSGGTWSVIPSNRTNRMNGISAFKGATSGTDTAYIAGDNGEIYHIYGNTGAVVTDTILGTQNFNGVYCLNGKTWIVGDGGKILYLDATGKTWQPQDSRTSANLNSVIFFDTLRGFAFGDHGTIITTTDGGFFWTPIPSGTSENLKGGNILPLNTRIQNYYGLTMRAKRKEFYVDAITGRVNFDYYVKVDSGNVSLDPIRIPLPTKSVIPPGGFVVVINDSNKFNDHTKLGPANNIVLNTPFVYYIDASRPGGGAGVKWDLLSSGEIKLSKFHDEVKETTIFIAAIGRNVSVDLPVRSDTTVLDVVRYGGYRPAVDPYPQNNPIGSIPEWSSISRYSDDVGNFDPMKLNTAASFYISKDPIPGWYSQQKKP